MTIILSGTNGVSDVDGSASTPAIRGTDTNTGIFFPAADTIAFAEGGAEVARFDSNGNLGIGTNSPTTKLNVFGSSPSIYIQQDGGVAGNTQLRLNAAGGSNTGSVRLLDKYIWASTSNGSELKIGNDLTTAQMVLDSSGNLLVGTTSASAGNIFTKGILTRGTEKPLGVVCDSNGGSAAIGVGRTNSTGNYVEFYYGGAGTTFTGGISTNGSTTAFNTSSDYRLKDNIQPMVGALAKVQALKPVTWSWKNTGEQAEGFIAHELAEVCPDAVSGEKDAVDAEGNPKYQGVDTSFLVATLTAAIQELNAKVDSLQAELATLKGQA